MEAEIQLPPEVWLSIPWGTSDPGPEESDVFKIKDDDDDNDDNNDDDNDDD